MSTHRITLEDVLTDDEYAHIDQFCQNHQGIDALPSIADFLQTQFNVKLILDDSIVAGFISDGSHLPGTAAGVCRPEQERECAVLLRACFQSNIPVTVSAGRSNLTGSATPHGGVILSTIKMQTPAVHVDEKNQTVLTPVGIIVEDLRNLVLEQSHYRLMFSVNPTSRMDAAIGGSLACNASGFNPGEVGAFRNWVQALNFILPNGKRITAKRDQYVSENGIFILVDGTQETIWPVPTYVRPAIKNASGPFSSPDGRLDFIDLVIGSEGIFGLATQCVLNLTKRPADYLDIFFSLPGEDQAVACYHYIRHHAAGGVESLSALEYFGVNCRQYMKHEDRLFSGDDQVAIYLQVPLYDKSLDDAAAEWFEFLTNAPPECGLREEGIMLLTSDRERELFFEARHSMPANALEVVQQRGTYTLMTDALVPPERFAEFLANTHRLIRDAQLDYLSFGHLGDCHLHFTMLPHKPQLEEATRVYERIIAKSAELGGVYSGEHGTGKRKRDDFLRCYGPEGVAQVKRSKAAVDPHFLLNRDNVVEYAGE